MKKVFIKPINNLIELDKSIIQIIFDNNLDFRNFINNIDDNIIYSENDDIYEISKKITIISDIYCFNINDKKNLTYLYKNIINSLDNDLKQRLLNVNVDLINIISSINETSEYTIDFEDDFDITKIFNLYQVKFNIEDLNYLELLVKYIEIISKVNKTTTFFSFSLLRILSNDEIELLTKELSLINVNLIDFDFNNTKKEIKYYEIDEDWCII